MKSSENLHMEISDLKTEIEPTTEISIHHEKAYLGQ
jgi:hypothetical protein